jgi:hypothetical protein
LARRAGGAAEHRAAAGADRGGRSAWAYVLARRAGATAREPVPRGADGGSGSAGLASGQRSPRTFKSRVCADRRNRGLGRDPGPAGTPGDRVDARRGAWDHRRMATLQPTTHGFPPARLLDVLVGGAVALVFSQPLFPVHPVKLVRTATEAMVLELADTLREIAQVIEDRDRGPSGGRIRAGAASLGGVGPL